MKTLIGFFAAVCGLMAGCGREFQEPGPPDSPAENTNTRTQSGKDDIMNHAVDATLEKRQKEMVTSQIQQRGIRDPRVLEAMLQVPRYQFVPEDLIEQAFDDGPLPIGNGQTISQPYIVALMTELAAPDPGDKALDVGTGSGYQAAVLSRLVDHVYSIEILEPLAEEARERLARLGYSNVTARQGDGYQGWPDEAPFDVIIVAAAPEKVPQPLIDQLAPGGRLVIPVGKGDQNLLCITKKDDGSTTTEQIIPVRFVPMTGEAEK